MFGNLPPPPQAYEGVKWALDSEQFNGYPHSSGLLMARQAVADEFSTPEAPIVAEVGEGVLIDLPYASHDSMMSDIALEVDMTSIISE